jgi:GNAT superfamily N-acetyltransferase
MTATVRRADETDVPAILRLLRSELSWPSDDRADALWHWKHHDNPFGPSSVWVGIDGHEVVAVRVLMRWSLTDAGGTVFRAARAVDTATHPEHRRRGWFKRLTEAALLELEADGVTVLFNTPNTQSLPANLSLGWVEQRRPSVWVRPSRAGSVLRLLRSRTSADLWPVESRPGLSPDEAWADPDVAALLRGGRAPVPGCLVTARDEAVVRWRYGFAPLGYRFVRTAEAVAAVRTRRRGASVERCLLDVWGASGGWRGALSDHRGFDHAIALGERPGPGWWRLPGGGPRVVARPLGTAALPGAMDFVLGDVELL